MAFVDLLIRPKINVDVTKNVGVFAAAIPLAINFGSDDTKYQTGSGAVQLGQVYTASRTITSGVADSIDLTNLTQPDGTAATFTDVCVISIKNTGTANITVGGGSQPFSAIWGTGAVIVIPAGVTMTFNNPAATGYAVTGGSAYKIQATSAVGPGTYDVLIAGH